MGLEHHRLLSTTYYLLPTIYSYVPGFFMPQLCRISTLPMEISDGLKQRLRGGTDRGHGMIRAFGQKLGEFPVQLESLDHVEFQSQEQQD